MATFKHISSKNADYGAAEQYLTFEHDEFILNILCPTLDYSVGPVSTLPIVMTQEFKVVELSQNNIELAKTDWDSYETSWDFKRNPLV